MYYNIAVVILYTKKLKILFDMIQTSQVPIYCIMHIK